MYAPRVGAKGPLRSLNGMLEEIHENERAYIREEIRKRSSADIPLDDSKDGTAELKDPGPFVPDPDLASIEVRLRLVDRGFLESAHQQLVKAFKDKDTEGSVNAMQNLVAHAVCEVSGLYDENGEYTICCDGPNPLDERTLSFLRSLDLYDSLYVVAKSFQFISASKKKQFGLRQLLTSQTSNVHLAHKQEEKTLAVMGTPNQEPTSMETSTPPKLAHND